MILELAVPFRQLLSHFVWPRHRIAEVPRVGFESHGLAYLEFMQDAAPLHNRRERYAALSHRRLRTRPAADGGEVCALTDRIANHPSSRSRGLVEVARMRDYAPRGLGVADLPA
jgi:hypothetical protein